MAALAFLGSLGAGVNDSPDDDRLVDPLFAVSPCAFVAFLALLGTGIARLWSGRRRSAGATDRDERLLGYLVLIAIGLALLLPIIGAANGTGDAVSGVTFGLGVLGWVAWVLGGAFALVRDTGWRLALSVAAGCYAVALLVAILAPPTHG